MGIGEGVNHLFYSLVRSVLAAILAISLCGPLNAEPIGVPRFNQLHDDGYIPWFEGVETNLYDDTETFLLTYDDLKNHENIYRIGGLAMIVFDINKRPDLLVSASKRFAEEDYQNIIDGDYFCVPTAFATALKYWADNGYPNLNNTEINMKGALVAYTSMALMQGNVSTRIFVFTTQSVLTARWGSGRPRRSTSAKRLDRILIGVFQS